MYEELIKRLRERASWINFPHHGEKYPTEDAKLMMQAADAIEKLNRENTKWEEAMKTALDFIPQWIPVTERLPICGDKVIVAIRDESGDTKYDYTYSGWYSGNENRWIVDDEYCSWVTHWMPLPEPPKEVEE